MSKKVVFAALAGSITSFLAGWLVYGALLADYYKANTTVYEGLVKDPPVLWAIFLGGLSSSLLMSLIFSKWANIRSFVDGAIAGGWIGFLIILSFDLSFYAMYNLFPSSMLVVDVIVGALFNALIGGVIGLVLGRGAKSQTQAA